MDPTTAPTGTADDAVPEDSQSLLFNQSLEKGLAVLRAFSARRRTMTLADVAAATDITKSSAQRMVFTLEKLGYLRKHPKTRRYQLTPRVMEIGFNYLAANALIDVANPYLSELTKVTTETSCLTEPDGLDMVYVARFVSAQFVPVHMPIGSRIPMYCTASGRAFLSALPEDEARALIEASDRVAHTTHTLTEVEAILATLRQARLQGFATNAEELFLGDMTIAAPVLGSQGRPVASVHVVAPTSRWTLDEAVRKLAPTLLLCARSLTSSARSLD
ncbi:IclR family transcriptional regulator [Variovorax paradoxus]|jgi:PcaR/PcaU/PobR family beta-ketoadipate pathway transcriptional regulator|uniref:IclR family transcriptional regulator n=1 Tax=Variovorax paradoxus TaxID=34073 RepID=UPI0006E6E22F|nr:IclR family transcriptional regulator [Variovorax paradoxus]KPV03182.1 IclR family transcriptional regulator [Variovorax paradoxus]KPV04409.1 IclR family transcriptional regulator [Variovorax paradoxus]KPV10325.1 IclR family transcriptional regulator [Variovorax paradoxus]KPV31874.1 IclR family transcriptional regulator [Variovorax paradoxus]